MRLITDQEYVTTFIKKHNLKMKFMNTVFESKISQTISMMLNNGYTQYSEEYTFNTGTSEELYPTLKNLENQGIIVVFWSDNNGVPYLGIYFKEDSPFYKESKKLKA